MNLNINTAKAITALLKELQEFFPNHIPINTEVSLEEVRRLQGHQEVIQFIQNLLGEDEDTEG